MSLRSSIEHAVPGRALLYLRSACSYRCVMNCGIASRLLLPAAVAWLITCCAVDSPPLNSERIQQRFGSYGLEIIDATDSLRHSNLYSMHDGARITRTFAAVRFLPCSDKAIQELHARVLNGASIGATFKAAGWTVEKDTAFITQMPVGEISADIAPRMRVSATTNVAIQAYRLRLVRPGAKCRYADILEIHHPDHLDVGQLRRIFPTSSVQPAPSTAASWFRRLGLAHARPHPLSARRCRSSCTSPPCRTVS